jgi:isopenicillin N synthase-like dioxygenase
MGGAARGGAVSRSIPTLDLAPFRAQPGSRAARAFVERLRTVCHEHGFFFLTGHGVDMAASTSLQVLSRRFFALPEAERMAIANVNSPQFRGYTPVGHEYTRSLPDRREELDVGRELPPPARLPDQPAWTRLRGPNLWPDALPKLRPAVEAWIDAMEPVGRVLCRALAAALGQAPDCFDAMLEPHPEVLLKIIRYPGVDDGDRQGVGEHRDTGLLTFVLQDAQGGLQVRLGDRWVDIAPRDGAFVVNLGEMMQLLTNGYFAATVHRVVSPPPQADRVSIAYFFNPKLEATLSPLTLPPALGVEARGGESADADNPILANYGDNSLKVRLRAHPDVARRHHADLLD